MLTQDIIVAVRALLGRVQLTGNEVPAYNKIILALAAEENELRVQSAIPRSAPLPVIEDKAA